MRKAVSSKREALIREGSSPSEYTQTFLSRLTAVFGFISLSGAAESK